MNFLLSAALGLAAATATYAAVPAPAPAPGEPTLAEVRAATARFRDVKTAEAEGYINPGSPCETAGSMGMDKTLGGMGIHYFRPDLLQISGPPNPRISGTSTHTDFRKPAILIYEPGADGRLELVAVENLVFEKAWKAAGNTHRPSFHGVPYERMEDDPATAADEAHMFEAHFDKHVWLWRNNPRGVFEPFNPTVTCEHAKGPQTMHAGH
ncbi:MAG TPA: hypothetical protein VIA98_04730 [Allosphingosinicella sp.]|jgi:hypothetical protein